MNKSDFVIVDKGPHRVGLQTSGGKSVLSCVYDKILDYDDDGYVRFIRKGFYGTVNLQGKICIPLSLQIIHLGVFHKGTARACRNGFWGLVAPDGSEVTPFVYKSMSAYRHKSHAYDARNAEGKRGQLSADGVFTVNGVPVPPTGVPEFPRKVFDATKFAEAVKAYCTVPDFSTVRFYYLDTDAAVDVKHLYRKGTFVRAGRYLETTDRLMRPVTRLRFLVASCHLPDTAQLQRLSCPVPQAFRSAPYLIAPNFIFLVKDLFQSAGVTQVLLLHLPTGVVRLAQKHGVNLLKVPAKVEGRSLSEAAKTDLQLKQAQLIHGLSLSDEWVRKMHRPIGLDEHLHPVSLEPQTVPPHPAEEDAFYRELEAYANYAGWMWHEENFMTGQQEKA